MLAREAVAFSSSPTFRARLFEFFEVFRGEWLISFAVVFLGKFFDLLLISIHFSSFHLQAWEGASERSKDLSSPAIDSSTVGRLFRYRSRVNLGVC